MNENTPKEPTFGEALVVWAKIGLLSFGGPAGQVALMHKELVERRKWLDEARFLHALNYCMLLPGPEAQQLATYIGWLMHKTKGGIAAGVLFVLPGFVAVLALSVLYAGFRQVPAVSALFFGLKAAVLAVVVEAVLRIGKRALKNRLMVVLAASSFVCLFFFNTPFPIVVLAAGTLGLVGSRISPNAFPAPPTIAGADATGTVVGRLASLGRLGHTKPSFKRALAVVLVCGILWIAPLVLLSTLFGRHSVYVQEGLFFSKSAAVTFGGAYAVLAYIAQRAVDTYGWLAPGEMVDGLGLAETTPGPLILVVQFVGFLGAYRHATGMGPMASGVLGSVVTVWVTFLPSFLWIFLGGPYIESLFGNRALHAALSAITAAVLGVIVNLSLWFGLHVVFAVVVEKHVGPIRWFAPSLASVDLAAAALVALALVSMFRLKLGLAKTLVGCATLGLCWKLFV